MFWIFTASLLAELFGRNLFALAELLQASTQEQEEGKGVSLTNADLDPQNMDMSDEAEDKGARSAKRSELDSRAGEMEEEKDARHREPPVADPEGT